MSFHIRPRLLLCLAAVGAAAPAAAAADWPRAAADLPLLTMRVQAVFVSDTDGGRKTAITPTQVKAWVDKANEIFASSRIQLDFNPAAGSGYFQELKSTLLNNLSGTDNPSWPQQRASANALAAATPNDLLAIFRWGPGAGPTGGGFSWTDYDFVAMPGFNNTFVCGVQNIGLFAHEVGHYLGLAHTHGPSFNTVAEAQSYFVSNGRNPRVFEGDGRSDTPPDPFITALQCNPTATTVSLSGTSFDLPRSNIMSYYEPRSGVSPSQTWTMRQTLQLRSKQPLAQMVTESSATLVEAESIGRSVTRGSAFPQSMGGFLGKWSGNTQVLWLDGGVGSELRLSIQPPQAGVYRIYAGFTAAPDFGIHAHIINGQASAPLDLYAASVIPTGAVDLGVFNLKAGGNDWRVRTTGSNALAATRYGYGLDYILLSAIPEPLAGDFDDNGAVDGADFLVWQRQLGGLGDGTGADANGDGQVTAADLVDWSQAFGSQANLATPAPEPTIAVMLLTTAALFPAPRRRRR
jgi:hypothetical protein